MMSLRYLILHNFWLKLFSIALATVIWLAIHYSIHDEFNANKSLTPEYIRVPVMVRTAPCDKRVFRITPDEVVVTAVGKDPVLFQATQKGIHVNLDLTSFSGKEAASQRLKAEAPPDIIVLEILPSTVEVVQVAP
jgi:hypothetical protein